jgi:hypothetical protein
MVIHGTMAKEHLARLARRRRGREAKLIERLSQLVQFQTGQLLKIDGTKLRNERVLQQAIYTIGLLQISSCGVGNAAAAAAAPGGAAALAGSTDGSEFADSANGGHQLIVETDAAGACPDADGSDWSVEEFEDSGSDGDHHQEQLCPTIPTLLA